jgi:hypothetical protein
MANRFQTIEQTLSWFSPCVLFCAAPVVVTIAVYAIVRVVKGKQGGRASMYDAADGGKVERVETGKVRFEREAKPDEKDAQG